MGGDFGKISTNGSGVCMIPETEDEAIAALSFDTAAYKRMDIVEKLGHTNKHLSVHFVENILVRVLKEDPNPIVRHEAAFSLGSLHWGVRQLSIGSVDKLCDVALHDASDVVRHEAAEVLGHLRLPCVPRTLEQLLHDSSGDVVETARIGLERYDSVNPQT